MSPVLFGTIGASLYCLLLLVTSVFLILLILVQRGRGGGLSGAFGGAGGQSAFGAKAGDTFTRITIGVSAFWIILCVLGTMFLAGDSRGLLSNSTNQVEVSEGIDDGLSSDLSLESNDAGENDAADSAAGAGSESVVNESGADSSSNEPSSDEPEASTPE